MISYTEKLVGDITPNQHPCNRIMNLSQSELNFAHDATSVNERKEMGRLEPTSGKQRSPAAVMKRLIPGSRHGEKRMSFKDEIAKDSLSSSDDSGSLRISRTGDIPRAPPESPGPSDSIRRILSPRLLSPSIRSRRLSHDTSGLTSIPAISSSSESSTSVTKRSPNLLDKIPIVKNTIKEPAVPSIYKFARKCLWEDFSRCLETATNEDIGYVYKKDGTTVVHMVVMSRTGYINTFKSSTSREFTVAPIELLEKLLRMNPEVGRFQCSLNGYTPLTYACLVCNNKYDVEGAAAMVRLFLKYCPESVNLFTKDGLSPVDIHIVSYSHHHQDKEDDSSLGRTSASVLRTLLARSPELANNRLYSDKVRGPLELLYKCNAKAFSQAVLDEIYEADEDGTVKSDFTIPERRQKVVDTVKKWWIWTWAVMILKYGSLKQKKRGAQFAAVHAAAMQAACSTPLLSITLYAFPRQIKQPILDKDDLENLPLHAICSWPSGPAHKSATQSLVATRKSQAISRVIEEYPLSIKVTNGRGETALELAAKTGTTWDGGVRRLVKAYPKALRTQSTRTGLYPFMTAAAAAEHGASKEREAQALRTIYGLLRSNPKVLTQVLQVAQQQK